MYVDPQISTFKSLMCDLIAAIFAASSTKSWLSASLYVQTGAVVIVAPIVSPSNLIGSETVNVPLAISTSVDEAAASTVLT